MRNPFAKKAPPPPMFDPFEVAEETARLDARIAEMGAAEARLIKATKRAEEATKEANTARGRLEGTIAAAGRAGRRTGGRKW
jgi:hypothetical protein